MVETSIPCSLQRWIDLKHSSIDQAVCIGRSYRCAGDDVAFTCGTFRGGFLTLGQITTLAHADSIAKWVIVGLNSDESVARIKPGKPCAPYQDRVAVLASCEFVNMIVKLEGDNPIEMIDAIRPTYFVKGGDCDSKDCIAPGIGEDQLECRLSLSPPVDRPHTTDIIL